MPMKPPPLSERAAGQLLWLRRTRLLEFFPAGRGTGLLTSIDQGGPAPRSGRALDIADALARNPVFAVLSEARRRLLATSGMSVRLEPGQALFRTGDDADAVYVVLAGELDVSVSGPDGREVWLAKLGAGAIVGEMGVLDGGARCADVCAVPNTELWRIGRRAVIETLTEEPSSGLELLAMLARRLRLTDLLLQETALMDLGARLARLFLEAPGATVALSQGEMARLIGASRERVNRKLGAWRDQGWIELGRYGVRIVDRVALGRVARPTPAV